MKRSHESKMEELYKNCSLVQVLCFDLSFYSEKKTADERDRHLGELIQGLFKIFRGVDKAEVDWNIFDISMCSYPRVTIESTDPTEVRRLGWLVYSYLKRRKYVLLNP